MTKMEYCDCEDCKPLWKQIEQKIMSLEKKNIPKWYLEQLCRDLKAGKIDVNDLKKLLKQKNFEKLYGKQVVRNKISRRWKD